MKVKQFIKQETVLSVAIVLAAIWYCFSKEIAFFMLSSL